MSGSSASASAPALTGIHDLPPEVLACAFEMIIYTSSGDISLILPLSLVCRRWHDIITYTPRFWGILSLDRATRPRTLAKRIARAKASPLSITADTRMRVRDKDMGKQIKALANLVENWAELDVGVEFLVAVCELDRNRDREREHELGSSVPLGCEPVLGWVDMCRSVQSLTLARGQWDHETPGPFFTHNGGVSDDAVNDVKLHSFTSISLPKGWILGFLGPSIKTLRLLRGERGYIPWAFGIQNPNSQSHHITSADLFTILSRVPNATTIELERTVRSFPTQRGHQPASQNKVINLAFLRTLVLRGELFTALILAAIRAPALQTLVVDCTDNRWNGGPLAPVFAQWSQPGFVMDNLHTLELVNCLKNDDDIPYLIRWLWKMRSLVRLFVVQESECAEGLMETEAEEGEGEGTHLFKALSAPQRSSGEWLCPSLMILRVDVPDTPIRTLISIASARGGIIPYSYPRSHPLLTPPAPARLRGIETRLCAATEQADVDILKSLVDNVQCMCMGCALHLPLDRLKVIDI